MKVSLEFRGAAEPAVHFTAETDGEKSILAFLAEGYRRRWIARPRYNYRAGGVDKLSLEVESLPDPLSQQQEEKS